MKASVNSRTPDITTVEAQSMIRLVARQLACGQISDYDAYNHVCDIGMLAGAKSFEPYFEKYLKHLGGAKPQKSIEMRLPCPGTVPDGHGGLKVCGHLHLDEGIWTTKQHHTHSCQACGHTWRPATVHTVGVRFLPGFKNE